mgnify:CR=1 FL=1
MLQSQPIIIDFQTEVDSIFRMLNLSRQSFSFSFVIYNTRETREVALSQLMAKCPDVHLHRLPGGQPDLDIYDSVAESIRQMPLPSAIFVLDIEDLLRSDQPWQPVLGRLNASRELWQKHRCPIVFWLAEFAATLLMEEAPDFWRYRSHSFELRALHGGGAAGELTPSVKRQSPFTASLTLDQKLARLDELRQRIAKAGDPPPESLREIVLKWRFEVAELLYALGRLDEAMCGLHDLEVQCRPLGDLDGLSTSLGNQAVILQARGQLDEAMTLLKAQERVCRQLGNQDGLSTSLGNQAMILQARGQLDEAMALLKEEERICRQLGNQDGLSISLGNQAMILHTRGQLDEAMTLLKEEEHICRQLGNQDGLSASLGNQAIILRARGQLDEAMTLYKEQEGMSRKLGSPKGIAISLANQARLLAFKRNEPAAALPLAEQAFQIAGGHGYAPLADTYRRLRDAIIAMLKAD